MSGHFDFAIISPSLVRTAFVAKCRAFSLQSVPPLAVYPTYRARAHNEGAWLAPLKGPFLITLVSGSPGLITLASRSQGDQDSLRLTT